MGSCVKGLSKNEQHSLPLLSVGCFDTRSMLFTSDPSVSLFEPKEIEL